MRSFEPVGIGETVADAERLFFEPNGSFQNDANDDFDDERKDIITKQTLDSFSRGDALDDRRPFSSSRFDDENDFDAELYAVKVRNDVFKTTTLSVSAQKYSHQWDTGA